MLAWFLGGVPGMATRRQQPPPARQYAFTDQALGTLLDDIEEGFKTGDAL